MFKCNKIYYSDIRDACDALITIRSTYKDLKIKYYTFYIKTLCIVLISLIGLAHLKFFIPTQPELFGIILLTLVGTYIGMFKTRILFSNIELNIELWMMYLTVLAHEHNNESDTYTLKNEYRNCVDDFVDIMKCYNINFTAVIPVFSKEEEA